MAAATTESNRSDGRLERQLKSTILERLENFDCVALLGPRQVGKTILAREIISNHSNSIYLDLQSPKDLETLGNGEQLFTDNQHALIVLDEVQCRPDLFPILQSQIDSRRDRLGDDRGRFLILGSASLDLRRAASKSLTGRMSEVLLPGFQLVEVSQMNHATFGAIPTDPTEYEQQTASNPTAPPLDQDNVNRLWLRGGFPLSYLAKNDQSSLQWRRDFIQAYIERDIADLGLTVHPPTLGRCWGLLASRQGSIWNKGKFSNALGVKITQIDECIYALEKLLFIRALPSWHGDVRRQLIRAPKYYVCDSGLLHSLLNIRTIDELVEQEVAGHSWEGFVIETLINAAPRAQAAFFYRDQYGSEVDLVLEFSINNRWAIEVKFSGDPDVTKGCLTAADVMKASRRLVVHTGPESFTMNNGFEAMTLIDACAAAAAA